MKNLIAKVFGVEIYAKAQNIHGRKSSGVEDANSCYHNWSKNTYDVGPDSVN
jgi:hypothetical protein